MAKVTLTRNQCRCVLCKYWNGAVGSNTIQILPGGNAFTVDSNEMNFCFKKGRGIQMSALQECPCFKTRYDD